MPRWTRAISWLPPDARRVLDDGAAFGFGTVRVERAIARRPRDATRPSMVVGLEYDRSYIDQARRRYPRLELVRAGAAELPFTDGAFDAVLLLDVLEHLPAEAPALAEAWRVLRPAGTLIISVPHRGPLAWADSLNLYSAVQRRFGSLLPLDPSERGCPRHRHYSLDDLRGHLGSRFRIERIARTGLGLSEGLNLLLLLLCRGLLRLEASYRLLRWAYYSLYLAEDFVPMGRWGYNLMVLARRLDPPPSA